MWVLMRMLVLAMLMLRQCQILFPLQGLLGIRFAIAKEICNIVGSVHPSYARFGRGSP